MHIIYTIFIYITNDNAIKRNKNNNDILLIVLIAITSIAIMTYVLHKIIDTIFFLP